MLDTNADPWISGRPWQIVRADLDLAHVFLPLNQFFFQPTTRKKDGVKGVLKGYTITHTYQTPQPDWFSDSFLAPVGTISPPAFDEIWNEKTLPAYDSDSATDYADASELIVAHMEQNRDVKRLEGIIRVPCHAHGAKINDKDNNKIPPDHSPMWINTLIQVYQFSGVVDGKLPLLVIRAPLSPICPTNGGGTATGYG
jgi:hypothetical protein